MYTRKEEVYKYLDSLNIKYKKIEHKAVFTMEEISKLNLEDENEVVKPNSEYHNCVYEFIEKIIDLANTKLGLI